MPFLISRFPAPGHSFSHLLCGQVPVGLCLCFSVPVQSPDSNTSLEGCWDDTGPCQAAGWSVGLSLPCSWIPGPLSQSADWLSTLMPPWTATSLRAVSSANQILPARLYITCTSGWLFPYPWKGSVSRSWPSGQPCTTRLGHNLLCPKIWHDSFFFINLCPWTEMTTDGNQARSIPSWPAVMWFRKRGKNYGLVEWKVYWGSRGPGFSLNVSQTS